MHRKRRMWLCGLGAGLLCLSMPEPLQTNRTHAQNTAQHERPASHLANGTLVGEGEISLTGRSLSNLQALGKTMPRLIPFVEAVVKKAALVAVKEITYLSDGLRVKGFLLEPKRGGKYPCLIVNRGGNGNFGVWTPEEVYLLLSEISSWGYIVAASQYRGCAGGEGKEEFGGKDVNDVLSLIPLLESQPKAAPGRIGMIGLSRGGMMTYLALTATAKIRAAAVVGGVSDLAGWEMARPEMGEVFRNLIGGDSRTAPDALKMRSAIFWPERLSAHTPLLILHGTADERVPPKQALDMASMLLQQKHPFGLVMFEGGEHNLTRFWPEWLEVLHRWFLKYLPK